MFFILISEIVFNELTHHHYCKKNKGDCSKCKDWSCPRQKYRASPEHENKT